MQHGGYQKKCGDKRAFPNDVDSHSSVPERSYSPKAKQVRRPMVKIVRFIHMVTGVIGSLIILMMSITGLLLNHKALLGYSSVAQLRLQKFIFALHSGSIGNTSFVWLTDFGAICMMVLSLTGLWMWVIMGLRKKYVRQRRGQNEK